MNLERLRPLLFAGLLLAMLAGCDADFEGDAGGECSDGADNDQDGNVDCADDGCASDAACTGDDDDTSGDDDDTSGDDDTGDDDSAGDDDDDVTSGPDEDGDGYVASSAGGTDCDDSNPTVSPAGLELCDGIDNDCDGDVDEGAIDSVTWHLDADSDGYGGQLLTQEACSAPDSYVGNADDCNDLDGAIYPGATELCNGIDDDCDGAIDDDASAAQTWYLDNDGDGVGGFWLTQEACDMPTGYAPDSTDCDDTNASVYPAATELCDGLDNDCDGTLGGDELDDDGDGVTECSLDCDDADPLRFPGSAELCDGIDNDCDAATIAGDGETDDDGDLALNCEDCADLDAAIYPGATEVCNGLDDDCDGTVDVGAVDESTWYFDADGDGFGGFLLTQVACTAPTGYVVSSNDCAELDANSYPGAPEICDGADNDCNTLVDDGAGAAGTTWYADSDGDGYGDPGSAITSCAQPANFVANNLDCDDGNATTNPSSYEICDGLDNNCAGGVDEGSVLNATSWYVDSDGDGYGVPGTPVLSCTQPTGYAGNTADCDDNDSANDPNGPEICDGQDNDCNGAADFDAAGEVDVDSDGSLSCADCDDGDAANLPGGIELCDGQDNDCNAGADLDIAGEVDADADGSLSCDDCDDADAANVPGGTEVCDGQDNDCNAGADFDTVGEVDADGDGSLSCADCDDGDITSYPGGTEVCGDGIDQDCDGTDLPCFTEAIFTTCGQDGRTGPSQSQCDNAYAGTAELAGNVTVSNGIQQWTVPATTTYLIEVRGARGGHSFEDSGRYGRGARLSAEFQLTQGEVLQVLVGQMGSLSVNSQSYNSSGGGGTFVYRNAGDPLPLAVAGGGGGGSYNTTLNARMHASLAEEGQAGSNSAGSQGGSGGASGQGGTGSYLYVAGAGAGWLGDGLGGQSTCGYTVTGGLAPRNGGLGGQGGNSSNGGANYPGGFGGGGGGTGACGSSGAGGGGGFSGGGVGEDCCGAQGGGGGSFSASTIDSSAVDSTEHGQVTITLPN